MSLCKGTQVGPYSITTKLNQGGMAEIYQAMDQSTQKMVALKISRFDREDLTQTNRSALRREVDILERLAHPGIVQLLPTRVSFAKDERYMAQAVEIPGKPWYYAMEFLEGETIAWHLKQLHALPLSLAALIGYRLASTLLYIHDKEVVHLDVKPENILLRRPLKVGGNIEPVLVDFGVAARSQEAKAVGGTIITMAPEYIRMLRNELAPGEEVDLKRVDVYAMGVVLYRMWTGKYPFMGPDYDSLTSSILNGAIKMPTEVNPTLPRKTDYLLKDCLSKDPLLRPSLKEIYDELKYLAAGMKTLSQEIAYPKKPKWFEVWSKK